MIFRQHQPVAVVEHDDSTRQPREGGEVHGATVAATNGVFTIVRYATHLCRPPLMFDTGSGWAAAHAEYHWRLVPVCARCDEPILGTPVTDPSDPLKRQYCTEGCSDADDEAAQEQHYPSGVAT